MFAPGEVGANNYINHFITKTNTTIFLLALKGEQTFIK